MNLIHKYPKSKYYGKISGLWTLSFLGSLFGFAYLMHVIPDGHWTVWPTGATAIVYIIFSLVMTIGSLITATEHYKEEENDRRRRENEERRNSPNYRG